MKKLLLLALAGATTLPAAYAQTGRVARGSYGGRHAGGRADNFGIVPTAASPVLRPVRVTRIVYRNDSVARMYGQQQALDKAGQPWKPYTRYQQYYFPRYQSSRAEALQKLRDDYPDAKLEGFDQPAPRKAGGGAAAPGKPPRDTRRASLWAALHVGAVGWLLGRKRTA